MSAQQLPSLNPLINVIQEKFESRHNKAQLSCKRTIDLDMTIEERNQKLRTSTKSIPLPKSHVQRTESELQFCNDLADADYRDSIMFQRLVRGIEKSQYKVQLSKRDYSPCNVMTQSKQVIENIVSTRGSVIGNQNDDNFFPSGFLSTIHQHENTTSRAVSPMRGDGHDDDWFIEGIRDDVCVPNLSIILDMDYSRPPSSIESIVSDDSVFSDDELDIFDLEL